MGKKRRQWEEARKRSDAVTSTTHHETTIRKAGASTQRQRHEFESPEEDHIKKLVLVNGVVHHSHESWLLRAIIFCGEVWRVGHVSAETADEGLYEPAPTRVHLS